MPIWEFVKKKNKNCLLVRHAPTEAPSSLCQPKRSLYNWTPSYYSGWKSCHSSRGEISCQICSSFGKVVNAGKRLQTYQLYHGLHESGSRAQRRARGPFANFAVPKLLWRAAFRHTEWIEKKLIFVNHALVESLERMACSPNDIPWIVMTSRIGCSMRLFSGI